MITLLGRLIHNNIKSGCLTTMNNLVSREIQEVYSREQELPRNVIITDTVMTSVTKETKRKVAEWKKEGKKGLLKDCKKPWRHLR